MSDFDSAAIDAIYRVIGARRDMRHFTPDPIDSEVQRLKLEGIRDCGELLVVVLCGGRERYALGRRTMPEMDLCSAACAIQNLWLAARAEGLGVGWVSLFDPKGLARMLDIPADAHPIAILCLGHVPAFYERPMLATEGWDERCALDTLAFDNAWEAR